MLDEECWRTATFFPVAPAEQDVVGAEEIKDRGGAECGLGEWCLGV
mgnify:CR=1 FL=1